jgi:hypothetical protein
MALYKMESQMGNVECSNIAGPLDKYYCLQVSFHMDSDSKKDTEMKYCYSYLLSFKIILFLSVLTLLIRGQWINGNYVPPFPLLLFTLK